MSDKYEARCPVCDQKIGLISSEEWLERELFCRGCKYWYKTTETRNTKIREVEKNE